MNLSMFQELAAKVEPMREHSIPALDAAAIATCRARNALDVLPMLGLAYVPAHLEDEDDGT